MASHGSLLYNFTPYCSDAALIARSLSECGTVAFLIAASHFSVAAL